MKARASASDSGFSRILPPCTTTCSGVRGGEASTDAWMHTRREGALQGGRHRVTVCIQEHPQCRACNGGLNLHMEKSIRARAYARGGAYMNGGAYMCGGANRHGAACMPGGTRYLVGGDQQRLPCDLRRKGPPLCTKLLLDGSCLPREEDGRPRHL